MSAGDVGPKDDAAGRVGLVVPWTVKPSIVTSLAMTLKAGPTAVPVPAPVTVDSSAVLPFRRVLSRGRRRPVSR